MQAIIEATSANQTFEKNYTVKQRIVSESSLHYTLREKIEKGAYLEVLGTGYGVKMPKLSLKTKTNLACCRKLDRKTRYKLYPPPV